jgi:hypothetical protein
VPNRFARNDFEAVSVERNIVQAPAPAKSGMCADGSAALVPCFFVLSEPALSARLSRHDESIPRTMKTTTNKLRLIDTSAFHTPQQDMEMNFSASPCAQLVSPC